MDAAAGTGAISTPELAYLDPLRWSERFNLEGLIKDIKNIDKNYPEIKQIILSMDSDRTPRTPGEAILYLKSFNEDAMKNDAIQTNK